MLKIPPAAFLHRSEAQRTEAYASALRSLQPWLGQGTFQGEEAVLADSGLEGEITARVGGLISLAFSKNLRARWSRA
jgi:hypothetical protein